MGWLDGSAGALGRSGLVMGAGPARTPSTSHPHSLPSHPHSLPWPCPPQARGRSCPCLPRGRPPFWRGGTCGGWTHPRPRGRVGTACGDVGVRAPWTAPQRACAANFDAPPPPRGVAPAHRTAPPHPHATGGPLSHTGGPNSLSQTLSGGPRRATPPRTSTPFLPPAHHLTPPCCQTRGRTGKSYVAAPPGPHRRCATPAGRDRHHRRAPASQATALKQCAGVPGPPGRASGGARFVVGMGAGVGNGRESGNPSSATPFFGPSRATLPLPLPSSVLPGHPPPSGHPSPTPHPSHPPHRPQRPAPTQTHSPTHRRRQPRPVAAAERQLRRGQRPQAAVPGAAPK